MKLSKCIEIIQEHNKWRRGVTDEIPYTSKELGLALDEALIWLKGIKKADEHIKRLSYSMGLMKRHDTGDNI